MGHSVVSPHVWLNFRPSSIFFKVCFNIYIYIYNSNIHHQLVLRKQLLGEEGKSLCSYNKISIIMLYMIFSLICKIIYKIYIINHINGVILC